MNKKYKDRDWFYHEYITKNKTLENIGREYGYSKTTMRHWREKHNIPINKSLQYHKPSKFQSPELFLNINTPEVAYLLGLIWADGCVHKNRIILTNVETDAIYFKKITDKCGDWNCSRQDVFNNNPTLKMKPQLTLSITSKPVVEFLIKNDYKSKSYKSADKILDKIPEHLKCYWFRGLVDGDGSICICANREDKSYAISIASDYKQNWSFVEKLFKKLEMQNYGIYRNICKLGRNSVISTNNRRDLIKFCKYIYNNYETDKIGLERKYLKYKEILEIEEKKSKFRESCGIFKLKKGYIIRFSLKRKQLTFDISKECQTLEEAIQKKKEILYNMLNKKEFEDYYRIPYKKS